MNLSRSWVVRIWLLLLLLSFLVVPVGMLASNDPAPPPASAILAFYLGAFLNVWSTVIIVLSAGAVSLEADIVADAILSRACTRTQYLLAQLAARSDTFTERQNWKYFVGFGLPGLLSAILGVVWFSRRDW